MEMNKWTGSCALAMYLIAGGNAEGQERKNVLLLMADDFNHWTNAIGYYEQSLTPNIDKLASKGVLFTEGHCASPVCNPSRNALLSGFRPSTTGISSNSGGYVRDVTGFEDIVSLNQYFLENEYYVYGAGKIWHPGRMDYSNPDVDPSHWSYLNTNPSGCSGGSYKHFEATSAQYLEFVWGGNTSLMDESNCNDLGLANDVSDLLAGYSESTHADQPFFVACGFFRPHLPWNSPKEFWDLYGEDTLKIPKGYKEGDLDDIVGASTASIFTELVDKDKWMEGIHAYLACLSLADNNVGIVLDALEQTNFKDNTIIVFMGDHGWHLGEKDRWSKYAVYDQANHTTMIIYDPTAEGNGKVCTKVVSMQDIYPTLVELSGIPPKTNIEGRSLAPLLENPYRSDWNYPVLMTYREKNYIKTNQYRFIDDGNSSQLYNVAIDPYEWNNLYGKSGTNTIVNELKSEIDSMVLIGTKLKEMLLSGYAFTPVQHKIPGTIEAEDYDEGTEMLTYHDSDNTNDGGQYRNDGVDISITDDPEGGAFQVGSTKNGEWLQYSVSNYERGIYEVHCRLKYSGTNSARIKFTLNDKDFGDVLLTVANTDWKDYVFTNAEIDEFNTLRFRVEIEGSDVQMNSFNFTRVDILNGIFLIRDDGSAPILLSNLVYDNILNLDLSDLNPMVRLQIYNLQGTIIEEELIPGEVKLAYNMKNNYDQGFYILKITDGENERIERFLIQ